MKKLFVLAVLALSMAGFAQAQTAACTADTTSAGPALVTGLTTTTYNDATVVDGAEYGYIVTAVDPWGYACSNQVLNVAIPATGTHSVTLTWVASTTPNVSYSVFRASPPTAPSTLSTTVN